MIFMRLLQNCTTLVFNTWRSAPRPAAAPATTTNTNLLSVPRVHTTFASRGFGVAAPSVWNSLPTDIRACSSPLTFRRLLKTHFCKQVYSSP